MPATNRPIVSSITKEATESFCLVGFFHLVIHPLLCETFLTFRSGAVCAFVVPLATTSIVVLVTTPLDHRTRCRTFGRNSHRRTSCHTISPPFLRYPSGHLSRLIIAMLLACGHLRWHPSYIRFGTKCCVLAPFWNCITNFSAETAKSSR